MSRPRSQRSNGPPLTHEAFAGGAAPLAQVPTRAPKAAKKANGFRAVDAVVALLALIVIGLSILGLTWLFRAN